MFRDTDIGGSDGQFPPTQRTLLVLAGSDDPAQRRAAWDRLIAAYWKPVYKYLRLRCGCDNEQAKDLTQAFFARALEKDDLQRYEAGRAAFRTFLRACLDNFWRTQRTAAQRLKRGGGLLRQDFEQAERELTATPGHDDPEALFEQEWRRSLWEVGLQRLRDELRDAGAEAVLAVFEACDLADPNQRPTYAELAARFEIPETQVTNHLARARRRLRALLLGHLRELTGSPEEFADEAARLLGTAR